MDINMTTSAGLLQDASDNIGVAVARKALDIEAQSSMALINAIPQPQQAAVNLPPNLGRHIDVTA